MVFNINGEEQRAMSQVHVMYWLKISIIDRSTFLGKLSQSLSFLEYINKNVLSYRKFIELPYFFSA